MTLAIGLCLLPLCGLLAGRYLPGRTLRRSVGWLLPLAWVGLACGTARLWGARERLVISTVGLLWALKGTVLLHGAQRDVARSSLAGLGWFLTVWPGMDPAPFRERQPAPCAGAVESVREGMPGLACGIAAAIALSQWAPRLNSELLGWAGVAICLLTVHSGFAQVLTGLFRAAGWPVGKLFDRPFLSRSLADFWSRRWNLAFVEMGRTLFLRPLYRWCGATGAVLGVFLISGLLHEFALSYPVAAGWGGPLAYFLLHGGLVLAEGWWLHPEGWPAAAARLWTAAWVLAPLPWLFHQPFRCELIVPLFRSLQTGGML